MKIGTSLLAGLLFGSLAVVGCEKAEDVKTAAPAAVQNAADKAGAAASDLKDKAGAAAADMKGKAADVAAAVTAEAQKLFDQAKTYIAENKLDEAAKSITSLEALKAKLPAEWAAKIDELKKLFDAAKAKVTGALPAAPGH